MMAIVLVSNVFESEYEEYWATSSDRRSEDLVSKSIAMRQHETAYLA